MGPGFLSQEIPQQSFRLQSLQIRTCPQEKPVPDNFVPPLSPGVRPEQGRECQCSLTWEERNRGDRPPLIFFACRTGSLGADNMGQGLQGSLDASHHGPGRMWLSLGEITALPCPAPLLLSPRPLLMTTL